MFGAPSDKPSAMEAMVAKMIGFTPEQMQQTITEFRDTIVNVRDLLTRVEQKQDAILTRIEGLENERNNGSASRGGGSRRGRAGVGGGGDTPGSDGGNASPSGS
jgi:hypothetical protein